MTACGGGQKDTAPTTAGTPTQPSTVSPKPTASPTVSENTALSTTSQPDADQRQWRQYIPSKEFYKLAVSDEDIWMLTEAGLSHFDLTNNQVTDYAHQNWHNENLSIATDSLGQVWVGFVYGTPMAPGDYEWLGVSKFDGGPWNREASYSYSFPLNFGHPSDPPYITLDSEDNVWAVTPNNGLLAMYDGQRWIELDQMGVPTLRVRVMMRDSAGRLWFGSADGVHVVDGNRLSQFMTTNIRAMAEDDAGHIWFGTEDSGVIRFDGGTSTAYTYPDGLMDNKIQDIAVDRAGYVWVAYQGRAEVSQFDGTVWTTYTLAEELGNSTVYAIAADEDGRIWFGTDVGLGVFVPGL
jgi:ligand-binding sensor domain-containing protein